MKNLIIIGAGGCGREVLQWAKDINKVSGRWNIKGFLDDDPNALEGLKCDVPLLGEIDEYEIQPEDEFACGVGSSGTRRVIMEKILSRGGKPAEIIHPTAVIADTASIGAGAIIYPFALISDNASLGDYCIINMYSSVAHDAVLGDYCTISAHCDITGMCTLGSDVFFGSGANMVPGTKIADGAFICAGSTVMGRVREGAKMLGVPAKRMKF